MTTSTMTIAQGLTEIKYIDQQIAAYFSAGSGRHIFGAVMGAQELSLVAGFDKEQLAKRIQSDVDGIEGLHAKRFKIKSAIATMNATASITIDDQSYTIAEALVLKATLPQKEALLAVYRKSFVQVNAEISNFEKEEKKRIDDLVAATLASAVTSTEEQRLQRAKEIRAEQIAASAPKLFDPANVKGRIDKLEKHINAVKTELDYKLSTVNVQTQITIDL